MAAAHALNPHDRARRRALWAVGGLALIPVAGCGFKPRGTAELPFKSLFVSVPPASQFGAELKRTIRVNGVTIVEQRDAAEARFELQAELPEREITALSTSGRPREYQLRLRLRWQVRDAKDQELIPSTEMVLRRQITVLDVQGIVNPEEEQLLYADMRSDAVRQIVRRMSAVRKPAT
jgi:LPS-assembly lipoprotein